MFPRSTPPGDRLQFSRDRYPPYPAPRVYDYSHSMRFTGPAQQRFPRYEWEPSTAAHPYTDPIPNRRKRHKNDYSPDVGKRQRIDSIPEPRRGSPQSSEELPEVLIVPHIPDSLDSYARDKLGFQMVELFEACEQRMSDLTRKESCRVRLLQDIRCIYAAANLYLTGSSMNGLGCRTSDADLCLVIQTRNKGDAISILSVLQRMCHSLSYIHRTQLIRAKVPILKFTDKESGVEFDLNVNNTVGIRNTFLLRSYAYADLRIRPLILVIKKWALHHCINDASKGTLSSYTLVLMVLHYLQTLKEPLLPSLQKEYPEYFDPFMEIDMVPEGPKHIQPYVSRNKSSLGELLLGFLKYYTTDFRWNEQVISVREATAFSKGNSKEWRNKFICVEEPFERNNVARAVYEKVKFDAIKARFAEACQRLHKSRDLSSIIPFRAIINRESRGR
uniref:polynucleotide adenylyltransferase n=1 Tax=Cynoglossus semilaevis TaxID=244447 RepID=A0A3P8WEP1_CYNSE